MSADTGKVSLRDVLTAAGIERVIWIDDFFDNVLTVTSRIELASSFAELKAYGVVPSHLALSGLSLDDDIDGWLERFDSVTAEKPELVTEIFRSVSEQARKEVRAAEPADYSEDELNSVLTSFGENLQTLGLKKWGSDKESIKKTLSESTLLIVDREFVVDGEKSQAGEVILQELVSADCPECHVVMLTHSVTPDAVEGLRHQLAKDGPAPIYRFAVMSKQNAGGDTTAADNLKRSIRHLFVHKTCSAIAKKLAVVMASELQQTASQLLDQSVYDLDRAVFQNSLKEGASEAGVIARILLLRQRVAVDAKFAGDASVAAQLQRLRGLRQLEMLAPRKPEQQQATPLLLEWRRDEVFDPGERVNPAHLPIACGDVFKKDNADCYYVLLAPPCDIAVRGEDGKRKLEECILVRARPVDPTKQAGREKEDQYKRFFKIPALVTDSEWQLDFLEGGTASLRCLDMAVFNADGSVDFDIRRSAPGLLLPGWRIRFDEMKKRIAAVTSDKPPKGLERLSFSERITSAEGKCPSNGRWSFSFRRVGRLRAPWSVAAYAAYTSYQTRAAFEHDFADGLRLLVEDAEEKK